MQTMTSSDIEAIERATIAAVSPEAFEELEGWILPFDSGTVSRARSAVPLHHRPADASMVGRIEARLPDTWPASDVPAGKRAVL